MRSGNLLSGQKGSFYGKCTFKQPLRERGRLRSSKDRSGLLPYQPMPQLAPGFSREALFSTSRSHAGVRTGATQPGNRKAPALGLHRG